MRRKTPILLAIAALVMYLQLGALVNGQAPSSPSGRQDPTTGLQDPSRPAARPAPPTPPQPPTPEQQAPSRQPGSSGQTNPSGPDVPGQHDTMRGQRMSRTDCEGMRTQLRQQLQSLQTSINSLTDTTQRSNIQQQIDVMMRTLDQGGTSTGPDTTGKKGRSTKKRG